MTVPYYADDSVTLYHGDCREISEWLEADVLVTDPPYGRDWRSGSGMTNAQGRGRGSKAHGGIANDKDTTTRDEALALWGDRPAIVFGDPLIDRPRGARQALIAGPRGLSVRYQHPHAKPLDVLSDLIKSAVVTKKATIADPFAGGGSTLVAASHLGMRAVGVELDERYCEVSAKRLQQSTLFGGAA